MRRLGVNRIVGLGVVQITSNITTLELFSDNESFSLVWSLHLGATPGFAYTKSLENWIYTWQLCTAISNKNRLIFDTSFSDELLRKQLFKSVDSCEPLTLFQFKIEPLLYALCGRAVRKQLFKSTDSCESFSFHHLWVGYFRLALRITHFWSGLLKVHLGL
jgi:hypothetical protein